MLTCGVESVTMEARRQGRHLNAHARALAVCAGKRRRRADRSAERRSSPRVERSCKVRGQRGRSPVARSTGSGNLAGWAVAERDHGRRRIARQRRPRGRDADRPMRIDGDAALPIDARDFPGAARLGDPLGVEIGRMRRRLREEIANVRSREKSAINARNDLGSRPEPRTAAARNWRKLGYPSMAIASP